MFYYSEAVEAVDPITDVVLKSGPQKTLAQILSIKGNYEHCVEEDFAKGFDHLEKAVTICEEIRDYASLAVARWRLGLALSLNCEYEKAVYQYKKIFDITSAANNLWGMSVAKSYLSYFGYFLWGRINLAYQTSEEAIELAEKSGDIYSKAIAYTVHGGCCRGKGFFKEATEHLLKGLAFCETIDLFIYNAVARWDLGAVYFEIGEYQNSREHYAKAAWLVERSRVFPSWMTTSKTGVARARVMMNEKDIDLESFYAFVHENKLKYFKGLKQMFIGEILLNMDDQHLSEAEDWLKKAIGTHKRDSMMLDLGRDYTLYAALFKRKDDRSKAKQKLGKAIEIFREWGADGWVRKTEKEQAALS
jgi:tetratricopeptide (TPR) repeat protein